MEIYINHDHDTKTNEIAGMEPLIITLSSFGTTSFPSSVLVYTSIKIFKLKFPWRHTFYRRHSVTAVFKVTKMFFLDLRQHFTEYIT